ncbi:hypothetical protein GCM10011583_65230 [Streptomyces camponoticapitis]|uniref:Kanamycin biosynthetic protein n=1 Tax=Streptomyces camponoticapitis TaxID=1616125 RepID=A0ABQ2EVS6_9ACTN|nr:antitoxin [Streptomyces camponoticapitis]GGK24235.1 hypothetical protein GCM10011583_65230 [Streptomyces camponoticapitis]
MSMLDRLKGLMKGHEDTARKGVDKAGDAVDKTTGGKYESKVDKAQEKLNEQMGSRDRPTPGDDRPPQS